MNRVEVRHRGKVQRMSEVIDPRTGEYRQDIAEKPNTDRTKKSGVQINVDETNAANEKLEDQTLPNTFDKTEGGQRDHQAKFGGEKSSQRAEDAITSDDTTALNPTRVAKAKNQK
jgi:hypothetical protein